MVKEVKLPNKLSDVIDLALADLAAVEKMKAKYKIGMDEAWHERKESWDNNDTQVLDKQCTVCFAGSVMAHTFGKDNTEHTEPEDFTKHNMSRFFALDYIRQGQLDDAFTALDKDRPFGLAEEVYITSYDRDRKQFKSDMRSVSKLLRAVGE